MSLTTLHITVRSHHTLFHKPVVTLNGKLQQMDCFTYVLLACLNSAGFSEEEVNFGQRQIEETGQTVFESSNITAADLEGAISKCCDTRERGLPDLVATVLRHSGQALSADEVMERFDGVDLAQYMDQHSAPLAAIQYALELLPSDQVTKLISGGATKYRWIFRQSPLPNSLAGRLPS